MKKIFIISPYNHFDKSIVEERVNTTTEYFVMLLNNGQAPVSVIVACHHLIANYNVDTNFSFWENYCYIMMKDTDEVHVLMLEGWIYSEGVQAEIKRALDLGKPIFYIEA